MNREELMAHLEEMHRALVDWNRYQAEVSVLELKTNRDKQHMVLHAMMVAIQSSIDIAAHLIAVNRLQRPSTYRESFAVLAEAGLIDDSLAMQLADLASFRNVLVHIYWRLNIDRAYEIL